MRKNTRKPKISPRSLLGHLGALRVEKQDMSEQLKNLPLEKQLLSLTDISIERETEELRELLSKLGKLSH